MPNVYTIPELKAALAPVLDRYGVRRAVLFGSYGKGSATEKSDVDLLVDSGLHGLRFVGFMDEVRSAVGKDVLELANCVKASKLIMPVLVSAPLPSEYSKLTAPCSVCPFDTKLPRLSKYRKLILFIVAVVVVASSSLVTTLFWKFALAGPISPLPGAR